ncbi:hypothetical protein JCM16303_005381, partial [Sporobolomyces ruberrimus]
TTEEPPTTPTKITSPPRPIAPFDSTSLSTIPQTPPIDPSRAKDTVVVRTNLPSTSPGLTGPTPNPSSTQGKKKDTSEEDAFEALTKRFAELKKK